MVHVYKHVSRYIAIRSDLVLTENVKCVGSGGVVSLTLSVPHDVYSPASTDACSSDTHSTSSLPKIFLQYKNANTVQTLRDFHDIFDNVRR
jgi:hypothetical protein